MQPVDSSTASTSRYARGVSRLDPEKVEAIETALRDEPTLSKSELARRTGLSRATVLYYLRAMPSALQGGTREGQGPSGGEPLGPGRTRRRCPTRRPGGAGPAGGVAAPPLDLGRDVQGLRHAGAVAPASSRVAGRGCPPTTNLYLSRIEVLLASPVSPNALLLLDQKGVVVDDEPRVRAALEAYAVGGADFSDYLIRESAREHHSLPV